MYYIVILNSIVCGVYIPLNGVFLLTFVAVIIKIHLIFLITVTMDVILLLIMIEQYRNQQHRIVLGGFKINNEHHNVYLRIILSINYDTFSTLL